MCGYLCSVLYRASAHRMCPLLTYVEQSLLAAYLMQDVWLFHTESLRWKRLRGSDAASGATFAQIGCSFAPVLPLHVFSCSVLCSRLVSRRNSWTTRAAGSFR